MENLLIKSFGEKLLSEKKKGAHMMTIFVPTLWSTLLQLDHFKLTLSLLQILAENQKKE